MVPTRGRGEVVRVDSYHIGLRGPVGLLGGGLEATFHKVAFSSRKAALAAKKEANYYWWDSR